MQTELYDGRFVCLITMDHYWNKGRKGTRNITDN